MATLVRIFIPICACDSLKELKKRRINAVEKQDKGLIKDIFILPNAV